ncbi:SUMF1/EgtB/PvdO family nonheme iron enzyme [Pelagicoccus enzymogenes]|uniref:SUMF1/EgtB/PvdO family nonheme iron enzyme n=1 Tax=Pelagicoccus enzymogenes TaxID=2773457 RepID=UPI0028109B3C|nr:SUMF1/EgtB/PvdO family nonheme iron enzyme [Pelagicoccus enzymogenes]MDQ8198890.1 SUMF1/EgtB/PvdO family nonheme iron enzyme [Pelagicoccus enzymogenes]
MKLRFAGFCLGMCCARLSWSEIDIEESDWFTLDLSQLDEPTFQSVSSSLAPSDLFGGVLASDDDAFEVEIDFSDTALAEGKEYLVEVRIDTTSTTDWPELKAGAGINVAWRLEVDELGKRLLLSNASEAKGYTVIEGEVVWDEEAVSFPLRDWPAADYEYRLLEVGSEDGESVSSGAFRLSKLVRRSDSAVEGRPLLLLHGQGGNASFFADANWADSDLDDDFDDSNYLGGRLALARPTYTLEVPNLVDLRSMAELFEQAANILANAHDDTKVDVLTHGMGGVAVRYYQYYRTAGVYDLVGRFVSLGAPMEGSLADGIFYEEQWPVEGDLARSRGVGERLRALRAMGMSEYVLGFDPLFVSEMIDPQGFVEATGKVAWENEDLQVVQDPDYLAVLGYSPWLVESDLSGLEAAVSDVWKKQLLSDALNSQLADIEALRFQKDSDGLATWASSGKSPIDTERNLYVRANHVSYNRMANPDLDSMLDSIETFLSVGSLSPSSVYRYAPLEDDYDFRIDGRGLSQIRILNEQGSGIAGAFVGLRTAGDETIRVVSSLSDRSGQLYLPSTLTALSGTQLWVYALGYEETSLDEPGVARVVLSSDEANLGARNASVMVDGGAATSVASELWLDISVEKADEMRIGEDGVWGDWMAATRSVSHPLVDQAEGEKRIQVEFRNQSGQVGAVAVDKILYGPATGGEVVLEDMVGGAAVLFNGEFIPNATPHILRRLPAGEYSLSVFRPGTVYENPSRKVTIEEGGRVSLGFVPASVSTVGGYASWLSQHLTAEQLLKAFYASQEADPDGDGLTNRAEYMALTDPMDWNSKLSLRWRDTKGAELSYGPIEPGVRSFLTYSADLESWLPVPAARISQSGSDYTADLSGFSEKAFYRVQVDRELPDNLPSGFQRIEAGTFAMGSSVMERDRSDTETTHNVTLTQSFRMDSKETTNASLVEVFNWAIGNGFAKLGVTQLTLNGTVLLDLGINVDRLLVSGEELAVQEGFDEHPAVGVTWHGAVAYAHFRSLKEGRKSGLRLVDWSYDFASSGYRLPTESEWEYACRAGTETAFSSGDNTASDCSLDLALDEVGWYCRNSGGDTRKGGLKAPNAWGLYDMHGNVSEWCWDPYVLDWGSGGLLNPIASSICDERVARGGDFASEVQRCRSAYRAPVDFDEAKRTTGFRLVLIEAAEGDN